VFPSGVTGIDDTILIGCENLREIVLPPNLTEIYEAATFFDGLVSLESISIASGNERYYSIGGVLYERANYYVLYEEMDIFPDREVAALIKYPPARPGPFTIPDDVYILGNSSFRYASKLTSLTVPASVRIVLSRAFSQWYALESITFLSKEPPVFDGSVFYKSKYDGIDWEFVIYLPGKECFEPYREALEGDKPGGKVRFEVIPAKVEPPAEPPAGDPKNSSSDSKKRPLRTASIEDGKTPLTDLPDILPMKQALPAGTVVKAVKTNTPLFIDSKETVFPAVKIDGYNWLKLRDMAEILKGTGKRFSVTYDAAANMIDIRTGGSYEPIGDELTDLLSGDIPAAASPQKIRFDGRIVDVAAYNIGGYNYFRLRDLMILLDIYIDYNSENGTAALVLSKPYSE
jgi:hypothetical protein